MNKVIARSLVAGLMLLVSACGGSVTDPAEDTGTDTGTGTGTGTDTGSGSGTGTGTGTPSISLRSGAVSDSGTFQLGTVAVTTTSLSAGGQTGLRVDVVNDAGARAEGTSVVVTFSSDCASSGLSTITPASVTTTTGRADATYVSQGCAGNDTIRVQVTSTADTDINSSSGNVTVQAAALGGIDFVSASPEVIGMTGSPISKQSTVVFKVTNATAGVVPNQRVTFGLSTTQGGITVSPTEATTDSQGLVRTVVASGSAHAVVRVIASAQSAMSGTVITTTSDQLTISTGLPDQDSFSLSASKLSVDGTCEGEPVNVTIRLADRYNNPVPKNTAITFTTEGGKINGQCLTGDPLTSATTETGVCTTLLTVQNPRPSNGRVTVLATAVGEESFADDNGNGYYDPGESFGDLGEAFVDNNENGVRDSGEPPIDFDNDGVFQATGDGAFTGYVCDSPGVNCRSNTVSIRRSMTVVFSTSAASLDQLTVSTSGASTYNGTLNFVGPKSLAMVAVAVRDTNGNPLPSGTTFNLVTTTGSVIAPATVGPFSENSSSLSANTFVFALQGPEGTTADSGLVTLNVILPANGCGGVKTVSFPLFPATYTPTP